MSDPQAAPTPEAYPQAAPTPEAYPQAAPTPEAYPQAELRPDLALLDALPPAFGDALRSMHRTEPQLGADGIEHQIDDTTRIDVAEGLALYRLCVDRGVTRTLEVGLAYGFSTLYLLAGLAHNGGGEHIAIDPYQAGDWHGIGLTTAQRALAASTSPRPTRLRHLEARSEAALVDLERSGGVIGLAFIDGYHRFDDVLVDFTLAARLCPVDGVIVLHDMWLAGIATVASFIRTNRTDFREVDTGCDNLFAVRRVGDDRRNWDHFEPFGTH